MFSLIRFLFRELRFLFLLKLHTCTVLNFAIINANLYRTAYVLFYQQAVKTHNFALITNRSVPPTDIIRIYSNFVEFLVGANLTLK